MIRVTSAWSTAVGIRAGLLTAVEVVSASLARIAELDPGINAFTVLTAESALAQAKQVDRSERTGLSVLALSGAICSLAT